jgi:hypothetical protein
MLHQKMQKFQRRLFYAPLSSEDNAVIENSKDMAGPGKKPVQVYRT